MERDVSESGDFFDIPAFIPLLAHSAPYRFEADVDGDRDVDFFDIPPFIELLRAR